MQGGSSEGGIPITAYVMIAMLENNINNKKAITYLESNLQSIKDNPYALAVVTYALHLADSDKKEEALKLLEGLKIVDPDGSVHWSSTPQSVAPSVATDTTKYFYQPQPRDVEMTAYALLTMSMIDKERSLPIVRWLTSQRNPNGGFSR